MDPAGPRNFTVSRFSNESWFQRWYEPVPTIIPAVIAVMQGREQIAFHHLVPQLVYGIVDEW